MKTADVAEIKARLSEYLTAIKAGERSEPGQWLAPFIDPSTLERVAGSYLDEYADERFDDALWRLRWAEEWLFVYVVRDHDETSPAELMAARLAESVARIHSFPPKTAPGKFAGTLPLVLCRSGSGWGEPLTVSQLLPSAPDFVVDPEKTFFSKLTSELSPEDLAAARKTSCLLLGVEPGIAEAELDAKLTALARQKSALENVGLLEALDLFMEDRIKPRFPTADFDEIWSRKRDELLSKLQSTGQEP
jgi:hypothetical protein